jgi:hypothetical protein
MRVPRLVIHTGQVQAFSQPSAGAPATAVRPMPQRTASERFCRRRRTVVTSGGNGQTDLLVNNGKIAPAGGTRTVGDTSGHRIDASGCCVLPGAADRIVISCPASASLPPLQHGAGPHRAVVH